MPETIYRCWNDSSHIVAIKYFKKYFAQEENVLKSYESEFTKFNGKPKVKRSSTKFKADQDKEIDRLFYSAYLEALNYHKSKRVEVMKTYLKEHNLICCDEKIISYLKDKEKSLYSRMDRFRKKALNNEWNYFVTITYDDKKHDEISFKTKLKKCLANLHDEERGGYRYMGVFERSKTGRLHFHALFYIPKGRMKGEIKEVKDYSTEDKRMRVAYVNTFFDDRFGRNDFIKIDSKKLMKDNTINYLLKYISKSDEPIFYSRGIATYHYVEISEDDIICTFGNFVKKYVLFDDVLENENKKIVMRC